MKYRYLLAIVLCATSFGAVYGQGPQGLFGYNSGGCSLWCVNADPVSAALMSHDCNFSAGAEIEYGNGFIYSVSYYYEPILVVKSPSSGTTLETIPLNFPDGGDAITALEFVGDTLYGGFAYNQHLGDTALVTIDINTGNVTLVGGFSGIGNDVKLGGLAYESSSNTMYAVTEPHNYSDSDLYIFDLNTGIATFQNHIASDGSPLDLVSLEFGNDGILYSTVKYGVGAGELFSIDPSTGIATSLGDLGLSDEIDSLTCGPPTTWVTAYQYTAFRGFYNSGTLEDTFVSDDSYLKYNPGITLSPTEAPVWLVFDGNLPMDDPSLFRLIMEATANTPGLTQTIEMFNWNTGQYEQVGYHNEAFNNDTTILINELELVPNYVEAGTRAVRSRIGWRKEGLTLLYPWTVSIDQLVWTVTE